MRLLEFHGFHFTTTPGGGQCLVIVDTDAV